MKMAISKLHVPLSGVEKDSPGVHLGLEDNITPVCFHNVGSLFFPDV